ncbi:putative DNA binding domain-containing protein [bacterium]|nr:putative DNA binding domain-containing protein [bacterium]
MVDISIIIKQILEGESTSQEFKESKKDLPKSLFETVSGFLNRDGGRIFLGPSFYSFP